MADSKHKDMTITTKKKPPAPAKNTEAAITKPKRSAEEILAHGGLVNALAFTEVASMGIAPDGTKADDHNKYHLALNVQADKLNAGDMSDLVNSLNTQFRLMETQLVKMIAYAGQMQNGKAINTYMTLALRLQASCRNTAQTICDLKNPRTANFIKTDVANLAGGHQQVNHYQGDTPAYEEKTI